MAIEGPARPRITVALALVTALVILATGVVATLAIRSGDDDRTGTAAIASSVGSRAVPGVPDPANGTRATRMLLSGGESVTGPETAIVGRLGIDAAGCVTLDDPLTHGHQYAVVAPRDSRLGLDGRSVVLTGLGEFALGDQVSLGAGVRVNADDQTSGDLKGAAAGTDRGCAGRNLVHLRAGPEPVAAAPDVLDCRSRYSSGGTGDYAAGGGDRTAGEAISRIEVALRAGRGAARDQRLVENTADRVRVSFLDPDGTVVGNALAVTVDGKWQIAGSSTCAAVGSVATDSAPPEPGPARPGPARPLTLITTA